MIHPRTTESPSERTVAHSVISLGKGSSNIDPSKLDHLLSRAKVLLEKVKNERKDSTEPTIQESLMPKISFNLPPGKSQLTSDIDLLINGIPEGFDTEHDFEDEEIDHILKQAGDPPSRLQFPSLYANNQKVMDKLKRVKKLRICLVSLSVHSVRFGIRKNGSFLTLTSPRTKISSLPEKLTVPLNELHNEKSLSSLHLHESADKKLIPLRQYFSGDAVLSDQKTYYFDVEISDDILQLWGSGESCIEIELLTPLYSETTVKSFSQKLSRAQQSQKLDRSSTDLFRVAMAKIPLNGLLALPSLDATVKADLIVDPLTFPTLKNKMDMLAFGKSLKPLNDLAGLLVLKVSFLEEKQEYFENPRSSSNNLLIVEPSRFPVTQQLLPSEMNRNKALSYVPQEKRDAINNENDRPARRHVSTRQQKSRVVSGYFGLVLGEIRNLTIPEDIRDDISLRLDDLQLVFTYCTSSS
jgi:hypothetical protein